MVFIDYEQIEVPSSLLPFKNGGSKRELCSTDETTERSVVAGYPGLVPEANFGNNVPIRQMYDAEEALNNTENYEEAVNRQFSGNNSLYGKVWWDVD